jgi:hypothetical protein
LSLAQVDLLVFVTLSLAQVDLLVFVTLSLAQVDLLADRAAFALDAAAPDDLAMARLLDLAVLYVVAAATADGLAASVLAAHAALSKSKSKSILFASIT